MTISRGPVENPPNGYALTGFILERDHHWKAVYRLDAQSP